MISLFVGARHKKAAGLTVTPQWLEEEEETVKEEEEEEE